MTIRPPLTPRQRDVLGYIETSIRERGTAPTIREICGHFGITSTNCVAGHLRALKQKGYITLRAKVSRGIELTDASPDANPLRTLRAQVKAYRAAFLLTAPRCPLCLRYATFAIPPMYMDPRCDAHVPAPSQHEPIPWAVLVRSEP